MKKNKVHNDMANTDEVLWWPWATGYNLKAIQYKMDYQGAFTFTTDVFSIITPTKTGSTSMRNYLEDFDIENKWNYSGENNMPIWDDSENRIVVLRHPMERYYSGLITMINHTTTSGGQSFNASWKSHIHPVCTTIEDFKGEYKLILLKHLDQYIPKHYRANETIDSQMESKQKELYTAIKEGRHPLVDLHYQRDAWWLRKEVRAFNDILSTKEILDPQEFKKILKKSLKK